MPAMESRVIAAKRLLIASLGVYASAWFVPVIQEGAGLGRGHVPGWDALLFALSPLWDHGTARNPAIGGIMVLSGLTNALFLVVSLQAVVRGPPQSRAVGWSLALAALVNACWALLFGMTPDLRAGYYLWWLAFPLLAWSLAAGRRPCMASRRADAT